MSTEREAVRLKGDGFGLSMERLGLRSWGQYEPVMKNYLELRGLEFVYSLSVTEEKEALEDENNTTVTEQTMKQASLVLRLTATSEVLSKKILHQDCKYDGDELTPVQTWQFYKQLCGGQHAADRRLIRKKMSQLRLGEGGDSGEAMSTLLQEVASLYQRHKDAGGKMNGDDLSDYIIEAVGDEFKSLTLHHEGSKGTVVQLMESLQREADRQSAGERGGRGQETAMTSEAKSSPKNKKRGKDKWRKKDRTNERFCPQCGEQQQPPFRFCAGCGHQIKRRGRDKSEDICRKCKKKGHHAWENKCEGRADSESDDAEEEVHYSL